MKKQLNSDLQKFYDESYDIGEAKVFAFFENGKHSSEDHPVALDILDWIGKVVLDVGCGTGMLVRAWTGLPRSTGCNANESRGG